MSVKIVNFVLHNSFVLKHETPFFSLKQEINMKIHCNTRKSRTYNTITCTCIENIASL